MGEQEKNESRIFRYLAGEMEEQERVSFQRMLDSDHALNEEVKRKTTVIEAIRYSGISEKVRSVQKAFTDQYHRARNRKATLNRAIRLGLSIAAIVFLVWIIVVAYSFYSLDPDKIYKDIFVSYQITEVPGRASPTDSIELNFAAGEYQKVVKKYRKFVLLPDKEYLLAGVSYLRLNDPFLAIPPLRKVAQKENVYREDAEFYLALAFLKNRDYDHAFALMQKIHNNPDHLYNNKFPEEVMRQVQMLKWR